MIALGLSKHPEGCRSVPKTAEEFPRLPKHPLGCLGIPEAASRLSLPQLYFAATVIIIEVATVYLKIYYYWSPKNPLPSRLVRGRRALLIIPRNNSGTSTLITEPPMRTCGYVFSVHYL